MKSKSYLWFFVVLAILLLSSGHALAAKINWAGEWLRIGSKKYYNARITIKNVTKNDFKFAIFVLAGGNHGIIEGSATIKENQAFFSGENNCKLSFQIKEDSLIVDATEGCTSYAGMGAYFYGTYQKGIKLQRPTLKSLGIFNNGSKEKAFAHLVGKDYELFVDSMVLVYEEEDLDGFGAKVNSGGANGLFTEMNAIIMYKDASKMWAAVIDGEVVKYYTTVPEFQNRLPRTIEKWREMFQEKKVLFMSVPKGAFTKRFPEG